MGGYVKTGPISAEFVKETPLIQLRHIKTQIFCYDHSLNLTGII